MSINFLNFALELTFEGDSLQSNCKIITKNLLYFEKWVLTAAAE